MNAKTKMLMLAAMTATVLTGVVANAQIVSAGVQVSSTQYNTEYTDKFFLQDCEFSSTGSNRFFILEPNYQLVLEEEVDGVQTRVVEERHYEDDELVEVSRNYFAICEQTNSVFYFGEDVDNYENGQIVNHDGSWLAGKNNAKAGLMMPGIVLLGSRYQQETAPGVALDRGQIVSISEKVNTPVGTFKDVLKIKETTPLEPTAIDFKYYAAGIGLIQDAELKLEEHGYID